MSFDSIASWMAFLKEIVSSSLIRTMPRLPLSSEDKQNFCLGLVGWCPCDDCQSGEKSVTSESTSVKTVTKSLKLKHTL